MGLPAGFAEEEETFGALREETADETADGENDSFPKDKTERLKN